MRLPFHHAAPQRAFRHPEPAPVLAVHGVDIAARYHEARLGGDFYDWLPLAAGRLLMLLLDIAGERQNALHVAAAVQDVFRRRGAELLDGDSLNEADAVTALLLELNRTVLETAEGVCCTPAVLGCYNQALGTFSYINAGHVAPLLKDGTVTRLEAGGLPLGLFSHATHDAQICALPANGAIVLASRGVIEARGAHHQEFGLDRLHSTVAAASAATALAICTTVLDTVRDFVEQPRRMPLVSHFRNHAPADDPLAYVRNDTTVLTLLRK